MMIQNTTFLRRAVGSLLVALVTLVGFQANAQLDFDSTTELTWPESNGFGDARATATNDLNTRITDAFVDSPAQANCYAISGSASGALEFSATAGLCTIKDAADAATVAAATGRRAGNLGLALKDGAHIDYEKGAKQQVIVTGYGADGKAKEMLTVNLTITPYDERPLKTQSRVPTWYMDPNDSRTLLVSQLFSDPEGSPVFFDPMAARNTDVFVCDAADGGDLTIEEVADDATTRPDGTANGPGSDITYTGGSSTDNCSVSNPLRATGDAPLGGAEGTGGNRVVTTKRTGPVLTITADSLVAIPTGETEAVARPRGTYAATVFIRAWSHTVAENPALSPVEFAQVNIRVKIGANNVPQFAGGATGYQVEMNEGDSNSGPMTAWLAGDLDEGGDTNDMLDYSLVGENDKGEVSRAGGTVTLEEIPDDDTTADVNEHALQLNGKGLDYEEATSFTVTINVTDNWSAPVSVPVTVTLKNVNELAKNKDTIKDQRLIQGGTRTFNLDNYFTDDDGDDITYSAHTNIYTNVVAVDGSDLTITGANTSAENKTSEVTVTVVATDGKLTVSDDFKVTTRFENELPTIDLVGDGTIAIGASVNENGDVGEKVVDIDFSDDDPKATAILTGSDSFAATVNDANNKVTISVAKSLNFEASDRHVLKLVLQDAWDETKMSKPLEIQVSVVDQNDAPTLAEAYQELEEGEKVIDDQNIVVNGSKSFYTGMYFVDEDGDRLLINAASSDKTKVTATEKGLDGVTIMGVALTEEDAPVVITLTATDPDGASETLTFNVNVGENGPPEADSAAFMAALPEDNTINVGATADIDLDGLFSDPDEGDMVTSVTAATSDEDVLLVVSTNNGDSVTLVGRASGMATLTITATDGGGNSTSEMAEITVNAAPEEAMPLDPQTLDRVTPHVVSVADVFTDSDDGDESLVITAEAVGDGMDRVTLDVMGFDLTITGVMGIEPGDVEIELTATDPHGASVKSSFIATTINIAPTVAMSVEAQELDRIDPLSVDVNEVFADVDGEISAITASVPEDAVIEVGEIDLEDGMLMITGLAVGEATVTLEATDNNGGMVSDTFMVTVNNVDPVVANAIMDQTTTRIMDLTLDISDTFSDPDTDSPLTFAVMAADDMIAKATVEDAMVTLEGLYVGSTTITVTATDVDGGMVSHDFMVEIENVKPTVAMSIDDMSFDRIAPLGIDLSDTFADADGMITTLTAMVGDDMVVSAMIEEATLTLTALAVGSTTITLTAVDDNGGEIMTDFDVTVVNIVPVVANAVADQTTTRVDDLTLDISETFNDPDQDNSMLSISVAVEDAMTVEASLEGHMLMISGLEVGSTNVTLTAVDADGGMVSDTFMTTIENIAPVVANSIADQEMDRRAPLVLDLSNVFMDADNGAPTITVMIGSGMVLSADDITDMMLSLNALAVGETVVTLTATDVNGASVMDEFNVTVVNIEPVVANAIADQTTTRVDDLSIDVGMTFDDPDQDNSMMTLAVSVADGTFVNASLSDSMLMISGLDVGSTMVTLTATDADGGMVETTFTTTVENIAPVVANSISPISLEVGGQPASQAIAGLFSDDGDPLTYTIASANSGIASASISGMTAMIGAVSRGATNFTITAMDPHGGEASVTGSVTVGDGELKAVAAKSLAGFGRALLASVSSSVGSRVMTDARSSDLTLDAWTPVENQGTMAMNMTAEERSDAAWNVVNATNTAATTTPTTDAFGGQMSGLDALRSTIGQNFALNLGSSENPSNWSVWGDIDRQSYEGEGYDGMASSVYLGADVTVAECWMFGVAISSSSGESDYSWGTATQTMDLSLTTVLPYVSYQPTNGSSIWGVAGFGSGELDTTVVGASNDVSDLSSTITMVGGSQELTKVGRMSLALRGDAATASLETEDGNGAADGLAADVNRIRVGLEGSFRTETGQGGMLEPFGQVNLRSDGGDGDTGTGVEIAGGVRMTSSTFSLEVQGRTLAMHGADEYSESGFSLMAKLNPSASATGVSVTIAPRWGADAMGNGMLWQDDMNIGSANTYGVLTGFGNTGSNKSIDTQIGYGMLVANEQFLFTPFVDFGVSDGDRREMLFGASLRQLVQGSTILDINLALGRVEERTGASSGKIGLNANLRF